MKHLVFWILTACVFTACSQNPHVLSGPGRVAPPVGGTPPTDPADEWRDHGNGKKDCAEVARVRVYESQPGERITPDGFEGQESIALDVQLPPASLLARVESAHLALETVGNGMSSATAFCLLERNECFPLVTAKEKGGIELLERWPSEHLQMLVYANPRLHWFNNGTGGVARAVLTVRTVERHCRPDHGKDDKDKKDQPADPRLEGAGGRR